MAGNTSHAGRQRHLAGAGAAVGAFDEEHRRAHADRAGRARRAAAADRAPAGRRAGRVGRAARTADGRVRRRPAAVGPRAARTGADRAAAAGVAVPARPLRRHPGHRAPRGARRRPRCSTSTGCPGHASVPVVSTDRLAAAAARDRRRQGAAGPRAGRRAGARCWPTWPASRRTRSPSRARSPTSSRRVRRDGYAHDGRGDEPRRLLGRRARPRRRRTWSPPSGIVVPEPEAGPAAARRRRSRSRRTGIAGDRVDDRLPLGGRRASAATPHDSRPPGSTPCAPRSPSSGPARPACCSSHLLAARGRRRRSCVETRSRGVRRGAGSGRASSSSPPSTCSRDIGPGRAAATARATSTAASTCSGRASATTSTSSTSSGASVWVYGQTEVQKDLVARPRRGRPAGSATRSADTALHDLDTDRPWSPSPTPTGGGASGSRPTSSSAATGRSGRAAAAVPAAGAPVLGADLPVRLARHPRRRRRRRPTS